MVQAISHQCWVTHGIEHPVYVSAHLRGLDKRTLVRPVTKPECTSS
jgi:hypothetical protein